MSEKQTGAVKSGCPSTRPPTAGKLRTSKAPLPNSRQFHFGPVVLAAAVALAVSAPAMQETETAAPVREIHMTAKKYEFNPKEIRVKQGERVRLVLTALDRKHGFKIKEFGIKRTIKKGEETVVEFVAERAGTFQFKCAVWCGWRHGRMRGKLIVEPAVEEPKD
ncbi:MAG: cupredoxin domain-containing protein [Terriglobia bacterium]